MLGLFRHPAKAALGNNCLIFHALATDMSGHLCLVLLTSLSNEDCSSKAR